jgi:type IV pilus assembly protein PilO
MPKNYNIRALFSAGSIRDPKAVLRAVLGVLLAANLIAAFFIWRPLGGSPQDLEEQLRALQNQVKQRRAALDIIRTVSSKVEKGRSEGSAFMKTYFLNDRVASMTILAELNTAAKQAKIKTKEHTFASEPIDGSADLNMMTINGNYEGTFADLMQFVNLLDRSKQLIIIDSLQAQPQATGGLLNVNMKLNTFVREAKAE